MHVCGEQQLLTDAANTRPFLVARSTANPAGSPRTAKWRPGQRPLSRRQPPPPSWRLRPRPSCRVRSHLRCFSPNNLPAPPLTGPPLNSFCHALAARVPENDPAYRAMVHTRPEERAKVEARLAELGIDDVKPRSADELEVRARLNPSRTHGTREPPLTRARPCRSMPPPALDLCDPRAAAHRAQAPRRDGGPRQGRRGRPGACPSPHGPTNS